MTNVVIVGMGFGGIAAAHTLAHKDVNVTIIDRRNYHLFQPLLYQVATAGLDQDSIVYPIRAVTRRWPNTRFLMAEVQGVDLEGRRVLTDAGDVPYDYLILAAGSVTNFYGMQRVEAASLRLKTLDESVTLRNHILTMFERATQAVTEQELDELLTFVVVGAGATGVETCGALAELIRDALARDYPSLSVHRARIVLVEALDKVLPMMPPALQEYTARRLQRLGVEIMLGKMVTDADGERVVFKDGSEIRTRTLVWTAGVRASALVDHLPTAKGGAARVRVQPDLSLPEHPEVYVIGDMAYLERENGECLPMVAPVAKQEGEYVARAILRKECGQEPQGPFKYNDRGFMAIIGRYQAVADPYGVELKGFPAWMVWLGLHLFFLVGFRNRLIALLNWVYAYAFRDPKVRIITGDRAANERV